jgi:hypothetical protein
LLALVSLDETVNALRVCSDREGRGKRSVSIQGSWKGRAKNEQAELKVSVQAHWMASMKERGLSAGRERSVRSVREEKKKRKRRRTEHLREKDI